MKKQSSAKRGVETKPEVAHLDAALTEITATTTEKLKRWWKPFAAGLAALLVAFLLYRFVQHLGESKEAGFNERVYRLFVSPAARKDDYKVPQAEITSLLNDVRGDRIEPVVYRTAVEFYLDQADKLARKAKETEREEGKKAEGANSPTSTGAATPPSDPKQAIDEAYTEALKLADEAKARLAGNADIELWAQKVRARIDGERKKDWLPPKWKYSLPTPKPVESKAESSPNEPKDAPAAPPPASETKPAEASASGQPPPK